MRFLKIRGIVLPVRLAQSFLLYVFLCYDYYLIKVFVFKAFCFVRCCTIHIVVFAVLIRLLSGSLFPHFVVDFPLYIYTPEEGIPARLFLRQMMNW